MHRAGPKLKYAACGTSFLRRRPPPPWPPNLPPARARRLPSGEPARFLLVAAQVLLAVLVVRAFRIESAFGFLSMAPLVFIGFVVHSWLPHRLRPPFFVALTFAAILVVFGWKHGAALITIGLGLIALCHLPLPYPWRVALVVAAGAGLALARAAVCRRPDRWARRGAHHRLDVHVPADRSTCTTCATSALGVSVWQRLGYFFLLPNICFPLFPVVDYQAFRRTTTTARPSRSTRRARCG